LPHGETNVAQEQLADFLKIEYNNIAQAHFNINTAVGEFFKAYIALVSLPISLGVIFAKPADLQSGGMLDFLKTNAAVVAIGLSFVWLIGLMVLGYLISLRCDSLLYARTVNGIRNYFYSSAGLGPERSLAIRVLPLDRSIPRYFEWGYFLFVVVAFGVVGTAYMLSGIYFYGLAQHWLRDSRFWCHLSLIGLVSIFMHVALYWAVAWYREHIYLA
jgi:hypothetical protein